GAAYAIAPGYRSAGAPLDHRGSATITVNELEATDWRPGVTCRRGPGDPFVSWVFLRDVQERIGERSVYISIWRSPGATGVEDGDLSISTISPGESSIDYRASRGAGLVATLISAEGLRGRVQFSAAQVPDPYHPDPEFKRLTGTFEWSCEPTPSD
ncbi:MAG: hypothetical protein WCK58_05415, partial [Chloroflexota bacterium]